MATSLDDETQQPSFHQSSLPAVSSPYRPPDPSARLIPTSSPTAEESAGGFLEQQLLGTSYEAQEEDTESLRESLVQKRVKTVQTGDLLRVETSQRPTWTTQPLLTPRAGRNGIGIEGEDVEVDELDPSSPLPPPEEEPPSVPSPASFSPPPIGRPNTRKRKTPPIRATTPDKTHKPISSHSPAKLDLTSTAKPTSTFTRTRSSGFFPATKSPNVPRTAPRAKRQKITESELPDSFADQQYGARVKPHVFLDRMLSGGEGLELPKEMRDDDGVAWSTQESEKNVMTVPREICAVGQTEEKEEDEVDEVESSVEGKGDVHDGAENNVDRSKQQTPGHMSISAISRTPSQPQVKARDFYHESLSSSANAGDTTTDSILFSPAKPDMIVEEPDPQADTADKAGEAIASSPGRPFTPVSEPHPTEPSPTSRRSHTSPPPSSPPHGSPPAEQSVFHGPRRGFTNVGVSQTQLSESIPDRRDLFSSQGEVLSSQSQTPASQRPWSGFQPTQVRKAESQASNNGQSTQEKARESQSVDGEGQVEPTQIVSEESHERAQVELAERRKRLADQMQVNGQIDHPSSVGQATSVYRQIGAGEGSQQEIVESDVRAQNSIVHSSPPRSSPLPHRSVPLESIEPTYRTRRSDDQATQTQANSEETLKRMESFLAKQHPKQDVPKQRSPERRSEPPPIMPIIAEHRQLRRWNLQETRSAPGPIGLMVRPIVQEEPRAHTDPAPMEGTFRLPTPPRLPSSPHRSSNRSGQGTSASQDVQLPSSSASQTEDLLPLGIPTQATESQNRSASPPIRAATSNRRSKRVIASASLSQSPEKRPKPASRQSSPITFSPSASHPSGGESSDIHSRTNNNGQPNHLFEPTLLNETIPTLPLIAKPPTPVKTYGMRKGIKVSPAKPPQAGQGVVEVPANRRLSKRSRGNEGESLSKSSAPNLGVPEAPTLGQSLGGREQVQSRTKGKNGKKGAVPLLGTAQEEVADNHPPPDQEETHESPDPLGSAIDHPEDPAPVEDGGMDIDDPPESASPPTQIDRDDYTYQPLTNGKRGRKPGSKPVSKKSHVGPPSEEGVSEDDEEEEEEDEGERGIPVKKGKQGKGVLQSSRLASNGTNKRSGKNIPGVEEAPSPAKTGKRASNSTAQPVMDDSLPEPESPPTPVDTTDETFQIPHKGGKAPRPSKKSLSRQPSIASTSVSAGPSRPKPARTGRKGRNSKLSVMTDDPPLPTPTPTSSGQDEDHSDKPLVFAYYKPTQSFYPGKIIARVGTDMYRVVYLDGDSADVPLDELRVCQLREGDRIKCDLAGMRKRADLEVSSDWAEGDGKVELRGKKGESVGKYEIDDLRIARATVQKLFDDRLADSEVFSDLPLLDADTSRSSSAMIKSRSGTNAFSSKIFLITPTDNSTLELRNTIAKNGGLIYDDHSALFSKLEFGQSIRGDLERVPFLITNAEIEAGKSGMKVKSMIALSFGIPILAPEYVDAALDNPGCDWRPYLISPGMSALHSFATSQIVDPAWGASTWDIEQAQHALQPLKGKRVLFIDLKPKKAEMRTIVALCLTGLGAISLDVVLTLDAVDEDQYDIILICNADKETKKLLPKGMVGNKKACDMQWLKQCMVSGACLPCKLDSYLT